MSWISFGNGIVAAAFLCALSAICFWGLRALGRKPVAFLVVFAAFSIVATIKAQKTNGVPPNVSSPSPQSQQGGVFLTGFTRLTGFAGESNPVNPVNPVKKDLHLLYLGRRHPLKGLSYLETALATYYNKWSSAPSSLAPTTACADNPSSNPSRKAATYYNKCPIEFRVVSDAFGDELERVWDWCDVLVLPTLSENFGLVIAEALERGKCVITTDGAPAWGENLSRVERVDGGMWSGYGGRLIYLKGYRDGTPEDRVRLLKSAIENLLSRASLTPPAAK